MRFKWILLTVAGIQVLSSCTIFSLHPLYEAGDLIEEPELIGQWQETSDGKEYISFEKFKDKKYLFKYLEKKPDKNSDTEVDSVSFEAGLLKVGTHYFLDLYPWYEDGRDESWYLFRNFIPTHAFLKIEWEGQHMILYLFDYDQMTKLFEQNRIRIKHEMVGDFIVITASTRDLQRFIRKYADDPEAFDDPDYFKKIK